MQNFIATTSIIKPTSFNVNSYFFPNHHLVLLPFFFSVKVPGLNMELKILPAIAIAIAHAIVAFNNFSVILAGGVGKNGSTVAVS